MSYRRKKCKRQRKIIVASVIGLLCIMSAGYAAFQTNLNINAKGNITSKGIRPNELKNKVVTSGDGLYKDTTEEGRYIYKGSNPNNYIKFNDEIWRIMSVESDGTLKIIRQDSIGKMVWDIVGNRNSTTSTYCVNGNSYGCNAWAATANLVNTPSNFMLYYPNGNPNIDTGSVSGSVIVDATLNTYLNSDYLDGIKDDSKYIVDHNFNVGTPGNNSDTEDIATDISQEALYKWNGKVGLMSVTDILKTTSNTTCTSLKIGYSNASKGVCSENNWMWPKMGYLWTISPYASSTRSGVWMVASSGCITGDGSNYSSGAVVPVLYLKSNIYLKGSGTLDNPYIIN